MGGMWRGRATYRCHSTSIAQQNPHLQNGQASYPSYSEEANPLHTYSSSKTDAGCRKPEPPTRVESSWWALFVLVREACPGECRESSEDDQRRVEEYQPRLCE